MSIVKSLDDVYKNIEWEKISKIGLTTRLINSKHFSHLITPDKKYNNPRVVFLDGSAADIYDTKQLESIETQFWIEDSNTETSGFKLVDIGEGSSIPKKKSLKSS